MNENDLKFDDKQIKKETESDKEFKLLCEKFETETGFKAIYKNKETKRFKKWLLNQDYRKDYKFVDKIKPVYYIRYFYDSEMLLSKEFEIFDEMFDKNQNRIWIHPLTKREYLLKNIAHTIKGIPIYFIMFDRRNSLNFELDVRNDALIKDGITSFDMFNELHSDILSKTVKEHMKRDFSIVSLFLSLSIFVIIAGILIFFPALLLHYLPVE